MPKKPTDPVQDIIKDDEPGTVRELRARLEALGNPWQIHLSLADDDPLPKPARGGVEVERPKDTYASSEEMRAALQESPPTNPFLQQVWIEAGWLKKEQAHGIIGSTNEPPDAMDAAPTQQRRSRAKTQRRMQ